MDYCTKWQILGFGLASGPVFAAFLLAIIAGWWPRRVWVGVALGLPLGLMVLIVSYPFMLVLWNGIRPAVCNGN